MEIRRSELAALELAEKQSAGRCLYLFKVKNVYAIELPRAVRNGEELIGVFNNGTRDLVLANIPEGAIFEFAHKDSPFKGVRYMKKSEQGRGYYCQNLQTGLHRTHPHASLVKLITPMKKQIVPFAPDDTETTLQQFVQYDAAEDWLTVSHGSGSLCLSRANWVALMELAALEMCAKAEPPIWRVQRTPEDIKAFKDSISLRKLDSHASDAIRYAMDFGYDKPEVTTDRAISYYALNAPQLPEVTELYYDGETYYDTVNGYSVTDPDILKHLGDRVYSGPPPTANLTEERDDKIIREPGYYEVTRDKQRYVAYWNGKMWSLDGGKRLVNNYYFYSIGVAVDANDIDPVFLL